MSTAPPDPMAKFRRETPYVAAAIMAVLLGLSAALTREAPEHAPAAAPPVSPGPVAGPVAALAVAVMAAGLAVLGVCAYRVLRGRPILRPSPAPEARWGLWDVLKLFAVYLVLPALAVTVAHGLGGGRQDRLAFFVANIAAAVATVGIACYAICGERGHAPESLGLTWRRGGRNAGIGLLACLGFLPIHAGVAAAQMWLARRHGIHLPEQEAVRLLRETVDMRLLAVLSVHAALVAPVVEELLFRALTIPALEKRMRPGLAIAASAAVFSACHPDAQVTIPIFLLGAALGFVYHRTRSLVAPVAFHMAFNGMVVAAILVQRAAGGP